MKSAILTAAAVLSLTATGYGQTFLKLNFDEATDGTFTSGTLYTPGASEVTNSAAVGLGNTVIRFVDSGAPDDSNEVAADGASIGTPVGVSGISQGGKALLVESGNRDEGLRIFVDSQMTSQSFTLEAVWFTSSPTGTGNRSGIQTIVGDNWPTLDLYTPTDPRRSNFQMRTVGANSFQYASDAVTRTLSGSPLTTASTWYHDAMVFNYNEADPANSSLTGYRNGRLVGESVYNAAVDKPVGLFGVTTTTLGLHYITLGMVNSFEYRIEDHRRGLTGGIDALAISKGVLTPDQFALPYDDSAALPLSIANSSFEADEVAAFPTYRGSITGWSKVAGGGFGVNTSDGPFMDNGAVPDGDKVLFLQQSVGVKQSVSGFLVDQNYTLKVRVNARASTEAPLLQAKIGNTVIVPSTTITAVGGTNPFTLISQSFQSPGSGSFDLTIENIGGNLVDNTLLVDHVEIVPTPTSARDWSLFE